MNSVHITCIDNAVTYVVCAKVGGCRCQWRSGDFALEGAIRQPSKLCMWVGVVGVVGVYARVYVCACHSVREALNSCVNSVITSYVKLAQVESLV